MRRLVSTGILAGVTTVALCALAYGVYFYLKCLHYGGIYQWPTSCQRDQHTYVDFYFVLSRSDVVVLIGFCLLIWDLIYLVIYGISRLLIR